MGWFYNTVINISDTANMILKAFSAVSDAGVVLAALFIRKKEKSIYIKLFFVFIVFWLLFGVTIIREKLTRVPDVVGCTYGDACRQLSADGLVYNHVVDGVNFFVEEQGIEAGTAVKKGTLVELGIKRPEPPHGDGRLEIHFIDTQIAFMDGNGKCSECFGPRIMDLEVERAYLRAVEESYVYDDFYVGDGSVIFDNIMMGVEYELYLDLKGYEKYGEYENDNTFLKMVSSSMNGNMRGIVLAMKRTGVAPAVPVSIYIADADNSSTDNIAYMARVEFSLKMPYSEYENMLHGDYVTDENGKFPYDIWVSQDENIGLHFFKLFGNRAEYDFDVPLRINEDGKSADDVIVFINSDGNYKVGTRK